MTKENTCDSSRKRPNEEFVGKTRTFCVKEFFQSAAGADRSWAGHLSTPSRLTLLLTMQNIAVWARPGFEPEIDSHGMPKNA